MISAIVPAAGSGSRLARPGLLRKISKPLLPLGEETILHSSLLPLVETPAISEVIIAVRKEDLPGLRRSLRLGLAKRLSIRLVAGGGDRAESVSKALKHTDTRNPYVVIHDGVRPFLPRRLLLEMLAEIPFREDGLVVGHPAVSTLKKIGPFPWIDCTLDRSLIWEVGTPQIFKRESLVRAYRYYARHTFKATDDASLVEAIGGKIRIFPSPEWNPKITTFEDYQLADSLMRLRRGDQTKFGMGWDRHRFIHGNPFLLGGVRIPFSKGAVGHSDGDVLLHAIVDGIFGALGEGDIGEHFPDSDKSLRGKSSRFFIKEARRLAESKGYEVDQVDSTVILERPKLSLWKKKIRASLSRELGISLEKVSLKAKTAEGLGPEGEGLSVSCYALVVLKPKTVYGF